jgi:hypothetical protein
MRKLVFLFLLLPLAVVWTYGCDQPSPTEAATYHSAPSDLSAFLMATGVQFGAAESGTHNSAGVARGFQCWVGPDAGYTWDSHETVSNSGYQTIWCQGTQPFPPPRTVILQGCIDIPMECTFFFGGSTCDYKAILSPNGNVTLMCKSNPSS